MGVKDARMTSVKEREVGWYENLSRGDECFFSKTFQNYECSPLDARIEVKKRGCIQVNLIVCLNTFSISGTLIVSEWHFVSI